MLHEPNLTEKNAKDPALKFRTHAGVWLFLAYAVVYGIFVVINLVSPLLMEKIVFFGMNLAVTYGIGLILYAILLALLYSRMCVKKELSMENAVRVKEEE